MAREDCTHNDIIIIIIVGSVASGKTAFLMTLLGEMNGVQQQQQGIQEKMFGFVPQHPFVISGTIRENILMGRIFSKSRYDTVLKQTTLLAVRTFLFSLLHTIFLFQRHIYLLSTGYQSLPLKRSYRCWRERCNTLWRTETKNFSGSSFV